MKVRIQSVKSYRFGGMELAHSVLWVQREGNYDLSPMRMGLKIRNLRFKSYENGFEDKESTI